MCRERGDGRGERWRLEKYVENTSKGTTKKAMLHATKSILMRMKLSKSI